MSKLEEMLREQKPPGFSGVHTDPGDSDAMVPKALRKMEETKSARDIAKRSGWSVNQLKRIWSTCIAFMVVSLSATAADINAGYSFSVNDQVTAAKLNNLVGAASINTTFFTDKSAATPAGADTFMFYSVSLAGFRKASFNALLLQNSDLITTQTEDTSPALGDFLLTYDLSALGLKKATIGSVVTNAIGNTNWIASLPDIATPLLSASLRILNGGTNNSLTISNLYRGLTYGITTFTNLEASTSPTNMDELLIWDSVSGSNRQTSLIGLLTNLSEVPIYSSITATDQFVVANFANTNPVVKKVNAGTIANYVVISKSLATTNQLTTSFTSPQGSLSTGAAIALSHGLGNTPQLVRAVLVCTNAELNYAVNDEVDVSGAEDGSQKQAFDVSANSTTVTVTCSTTTPRILNRTTGTQTAITAVDWNIKVYCMRFNY